jgi:hypothetical protein
MEKNRITCGQSAGNYGTTVHIQLYVGSFVVDMPDDENQTETNRSIELGCCMLGNMWILKLIKFVSWVLFSQKLNLKFCDPYISKLQ